MTNLKGPHFVRYMGPVLDALRALGVSGVPGEVADKVAELAGVSDDELEQTLASGDSRFRNQVAWARFYLVKAGLVDSSRRGIWALTTKGRDTRLEHSEAYRLFKTIHSRFVRTEDAQKPTPDEESTSPDEAQDLVDHRVALLEILQSLPPDGFERISQRLLRESGFKEVVVTGKSGDGGIDGHGILEVNPFVTFTVLFQCKRYTTTSVSASHVRDFRGAMMGRADKGIIISTGTFTAAARKEARRDGASPIELVDGEMLVEMFEKRSLGLNERVTYDIDEDFFDAFR